MTIPAEPRDIRSAETSRGEDGTGVPVRACRVASERVES